MEAGRAVCEVCAEPMEAGADVVKVGACEFPFYVHEGCRDGMGPVAEFVEDLCRLSEDQPEGLLWLGSWDAGRDQGDTEATAEDAR